MRDGKFRMDTNEPVFLDIDPKARERNESPSFRLAVHALVTGAILTSTYLFIDRLKDSQREIKEVEKEMVVLKSQYQQGINGDQLYNQILDHIEYIKNPTVNGPMFIRTSSQVRELEDRLADVAATQRTNKQYSLTPQRKE